MMAEAEKQEFVHHAVMQMAAYTLPFLTQVVGVIDEREGEFRGTGFFCALGGREAIVTADHVREEAIREGRFRSLAFSRGSGVPPAIAPGELRSFDRESYDLAVYYPSAGEFWVGAEKSYWPEGRIESDPGTILKDYLFIQGFPQRYSHFTTLGGHALASETLAYGAMVRYGECDIPAQERSSFDRELPEYRFLPSGFLQPHQFAINFWFEPEHLIDAEADSRRARDWSEVFEPADETQALPPGSRIRGAYGLSGSPVWRLGASGGRASEWTPDRSQLVGVITGWNAEQRVLIATHAARIFEAA